MKNQSMFIILLCMFFSCKNIIASETKSLLTEDKIKGLLLLGAYGDAQASITEFDDLAILQTKRPDSEITGYPSIPELKTIKTYWPYARFTDDTHMSLYLIHALLQSKDQSTDAILNNTADNFINWVHADQTGRAPGNAATQNTYELQSLKNKQVSDMPYWSRGKLSSLNVSRPNRGLREKVYNKEGGSGAVMRVSPIALFITDPFIAERLAVAQGVLTHTDSGSRAASAGFNAALFEIAKDKSLHDIWKAAITSSAKYDDRPYSQPYNPQLYNYGMSHFSKNGCSALCVKAYEYFQLGLKKKTYAEVLDEFRGWGATEALPAALYIFSMWNDDPYTAMSIAINRTPGDSDTIAKMVGELLGLQYGYQALVQNFNYHGMNFDKELKSLENISNLAEYPQDFPEFAKRNIKTFDDLAKHIAQNAQVQSAFPKKSSKTKGVTFQLPQDHQDQATAKEQKTITLKQANNLLNWWNSAASLLSTTSISTFKKKYPEFILTIGDMMQLPVDCIVNAANSKIQSGGGIDGIITRNINPGTLKPYDPPVGDTSNQILKELAIFKTIKPYPINQQGELPEGQAIITESGTILNQNAQTIKFVISTVGPKGPIATQAKNIELFNCYKQSLLLAANIKNSASKLLDILHHDYSSIRTIAFPSISTGIFKYPLQQATEMAINACLLFMQEYPNAFDKVHLVLLSNQSPFPEYKQELQKDIYKKMLKQNQLPSNVKLSIQTWHNGEKTNEEIIYDPASND